eukprot:5374980-Prymnesium_polylepis.1
MADFEERVKSDLQEACAILTEVRGLRQPPAPTPPHPPCATPPTVCHPTHRVPPHAPCATPRAVCHPTR